MKAQALFFQGAVVAAVFSALMLAAGWLWFDHEASRGEAQWERGQMSDYDLPDVTEDRNLADSHRFLLLIIPPSILVAWLAASWMLFGRQSLRLDTLKSYEWTPK